jgi:hypothetical protein
MPENSPFSNVESDKICYILFFFSYVVTYVRFPLIYQQRDARRDAVCIPSGDRTKGSASDSAVVILQQGTSF